VGVDTIGSYPVYGGESVTVENNPVTVADVIHKINNPG
jgi:hypothetical protein